MPKLRRWLLVPGIVISIAGSGCSTLLSADPTPVHTPEASPGASAVPSRVAAAGSPSALPAATSQAASEADVTDLQRRVEQAVASPDLPGIESLLLDHVSLSTSGGGSVMDNSETAAWLRDHAGPGIKVTQMQRDTQTPLLQVLTDGWPARDPIQQGRVSFSLRRYDAQGRPDEDLGEWKIDVIEAD